MQMRTWEIPDDKFYLLVERLPFSKRMRDALTTRYEDNWRTRSSVAGKYNLTEHGIMKAEKQLLEAHEKFEKVYGSE